MILILVYVVVCIIILLYSHWNSIAVIATMSTALLLMNKERVFTGGVPPCNVSRLMIVYHDEDSKEGKALAGQFAGSYTETTIYRANDSDENKLLVVERVDRHPIEIIMVDAASYTVGNLHYENPTNILIFVNHAVPPPQDKIYKSAFPFLWKSSNSVTLTSTDMTLLDTNKVTLLPSDFDPAMVLKAPNFTSYGNIEDAYGTLMRYKDSANTYKVGESVYTKQPPNENTPNYDDDYVFSINHKDIFMQDKLKVGQPWEKKHTAIMSAYVQPNSIVLDIGANIGTVGILLSRAVRGECVVYAFEPFPPTHRLLQHNIESNRCTNVIAFPVFVGDEYRPVVKLPVPDPKHTTVAQLGTNGVAVRMLTIDQLLSDNDHVSVMKVDVEGSEPLVFYGAQETIRRCMPVIFYERNSQCIDKDVKDTMGLPAESVNFDIVVFCRSLGYTDIRQMSKDNYMLVPPNREMQTPNSVITFAPFKPGTKITNHVANTLTGYTILEGSHANWNDNQQEKKLQKNNDRKEHLSSWRADNLRPRQPNNPSSWRRN